MIHHRTDCDTLIIVGTDDADQGEVKRLARDGLERRLRVTVFRELRGERMLLAVVQRTRDGFRVRGPHAGDTRRTAEAAVWLALARFKVDHIGDLARV